MEFLNDLEVCEMAKTLTSKQAAREILANFLPLVNEIKIDSTKLASVREDLISKSVLPADHSDWIPLVSTANGNCLFNAVSIAISATGLHDTSVWLFCSSSNKYPVEQ